MTHDELILQLQYDRPWEYIKYQQALRAVVELHEPVISMTGLPVCTQCCEFALKYGQPREVAIYPCKTIEAIIKELS